MSTSTATNRDTNATRRTFAEAAAKKLPRLICVGYVSGVGEGKETSSGTYIWQPISIEGVDASRSTRTSLLYRPEQFVAGFNPDSYHDMVDDNFTEKDAENLISVYRRHISGRGTISTLQGLVGSDEAFANLADALIKDSLDEVTIDGVRQTLTDFFANNNDPRTGEPVLIGYELKQASSKSGEQDENGKDIYILENKYDVDSFWFVNEKTIKAAARRAEKSGGKTKMCFDPSGVPF